MSPKRVQRKQLRVLILNILKSKISCFMTKMRKRSSLSLRIKSKNELSNKWLSMRNESWNLNKSLCRLSFDKTISNSNLVNKKKLKLLMNVKRSSKGEWKRSSIFKTWQRVRSKSKNLSFWKSNLRRRRKCSHNTYL